MKINNYKWSSARCEYKITDTQMNCKQKPHIIITAEIRLLYYKWYKNPTNCIMLDIRNYVFYICQVRNAFQYKQWNHQNHSPMPIVSSLLHTVLLRQKIKRNNYKCSSARCEYKITDTQINCKQKPHIIITAKIRLLYHKWKKTATNRIILDIRILYLPST